MSSFAKIPFIALVATCLILLVGHKALEESEHPTTQTRADTLQVGNVVYSMLQEQDFIKYNGPGWRLLNGDTLPPNSLLRQLFGIDTLPDARGLFISCTTNATERDAGSIEQASNLQHYHRAVTNYPNTVQDMAWPQDRPQEPRPAGAFTYGVEQVDTKEAVWSDEAMAQDIRPKNIALYVYIKDYLIPIPAAR